MANWIAGAVGSNKGSLHRALGVAAKKKIPPGKIAAAANSSDTNLKRKAQLAKTLMGFSRK